DLAPVDHDRLELQERQGLADHLRIPLVARRLDDARAVHDTAEGVDREPGVDHRRDIAGRLIGGRGQRRLAAHDMLPRCVAHEWKIFGPDRGDRVRAGTRHWEVADARRLLPAGTGARYGEEDQRHSAQVHWDGEFYTDGVIWSAPHGRQTPGAARRSTVRQRTPPAAIGAARAAIA